MARRNNPDTTELALLALGGHWVVGIPPLSVLVDFPALR